MRKNELAKFLAAVIAIIVAFAFCIQPLASSIKQGLDLQGGTHVVLEAIDTPEAKVDDDSVNRVVRIIERRVNELGLTEPIIQREGQRRIIVELPGIKDPDSAIKLIGKTAMLEFQDPNGVTVLTGSDLKDARAQMDQAQQNLVALEFTSEGAEKFAKVTAENIGRPISILLDKQVLTSPTVQAIIPNGKAVITGNRTMEEAQDLAILLRSGSLPVKVEVMETRTVGPSLGQDSKDKSVVAFGVGIGAVVLFMLVFYRMSGVIANIALLLYTLLILLTLNLLNATLTLPGIAGIILSIGMAVDANVLIFERFKEEIRAGKTLRAAMDAGFHRAMTTIIDSNVTTSIAGVVLFFLGTGSIKGFAITMLVGIVLSMFTAVTVTQFLMKSLLNSKAITNSKFFGV